MKNIKLGFLLVAALVSGFAHAVERIDAVIYNDGKIENVPFTLDQPIVIVDAKKPVSMVFRRNEHQLLVVELCDYTPPATRSPCSSYLVDGVPQYAFVRYGISLHVNAPSPPRTEHGL